MVSEVTAQFAQFCDENGWYKTYSWSFIALFSTSSREWLHNVSLWEYSIFDNVLMKKLLDDFHFWARFLKLIISSSFSFSWISFALMARCKSCRSLWTRRRVYFCIFRSFLVSMKELSASAILFLKFQHSTASSHDRMLSKGVDFPWSSISSSSPTLNLSILTNTTKVCCRSFWAFYAVLYKLLRLLLDPTILWMHRRQTVHTTKGNVMNRAEEECKSLNNSWPNKILPGFADLSF